MLAGLAYFDPQLNKMVTTMLPRSSRALRGWTKIGSADLLFPLGLLLPVAGHMLQRGLPAHALAVLIQHNAYLRPGELTELTVMQLVPPILGAQKP